MKTLTANEFTQAIARRWIGRRETQGLKPGTKKHAERQLEFFIGAFSAAEAIEQPCATAVLMLLSVGRDADDLLPKETT